MNNKLIVFTNVLRPMHQRVGLGSKNQPEKRQSVIISAIQKHFEESIIITSSTLIPYNWIKNIHTAEYLEFLESAYASWQQSKDPDWEEGNALVPHEFFRSKHTKLPIYKQSGFYGTDTMTPIYEDTYRNAMIAAGRAYAAAESWYKESNSVIYVLACSPGHHAKISNYTGYCFLNNAVIAAERYHEFKDKKIAILDLDYHAGNGTASIVANNKDKYKWLLACSIHVDPNLDYPSNEGYEDDYPECDNIINMPLDGGTEKEAYLEALNEMCDKIKKWNAESLIIAFGADTFADDPDTNKVGSFKLRVEDYTVVAEMIREKLGNIPILVTQEGGYNLEVVPEIVCKFLDSLL